MKKEIEISEACLTQLLETNRRQKGSIGFEPTASGELVLTFNDYKKSKCERRQPQRLLALPNGWLRKTARMYQLHLSVKDQLGEYRASEELARDTEEARQFLRHLSNVLNIV